MALDNPLRPFLEQQGVLVLDGGLATHLETLGCDLRDALWSARVLLENPDLIRQAHLDYFWAGADCAITASYQATIPALLARGLTETAAADLIRLSVQLAMQARDEFWQHADHTRRLRPMVAASIGPYGAYLADGSEYSGDYDLDEDGLVAFHQERWHILADSGADILACETIPSFAEARAYGRLLLQTPQRMAWFSFSCRDGQHISDGTPIADCAAYLDALPQVAAVGVNCTPPRFIPSLIQAIQQATTKPIIVYPNSGEAYDPVAKVWQGLNVPTEFGTFSREWRKLGAALIGGCCRTGPAHIRQIRDRVPGWRG
ncbi:MAG: homocysteine S-methyltransferase [Ardenticatenaceae bacterium]|nr:homocysteine S-methyltransferase [Ardenticatenaceae bacterium]